MSSDLERLKAAEEEVSASEGSGSYSSSSDSEGEQNIGEEQDDVKELPRRDSGDDSDTARDRLSSVADTHRTRTHEPLGAADVEMADLKKEPFSASEPQGIGTGNKRSHSPRKHKKKHSNGKHKHKHKKQHKVHSSPT